MNTVVLTWREMRRREFLLSWLAIPWIGRADGNNARPKQIYLIRHAEKNGDKTDIHLNPRGYQRAAALLKLFPDRYETPDLLFASRASEHSNREVETLAPLAEALRLPIDHTFENGDYLRLAAQLLTRYPGKTILVCWHHGSLPAFATALGVHNAPSPWPENQYDRLWRIRFSAAGAAMENLPERLLDGDS